MATPSDAFRARSTSHPQDPRLETHARYAIAQFLADRSRGELAVEGAALYQGLHRLERKAHQIALGHVRTKRRVASTTSRPMDARSSSPKPTGGSAMPPPSHACSR